MIVPLFLLVFQHRITCFFHQTYAVVTSFSEQTKKVVKLNTEDHEPEDIERGNPIKNGCIENTFVILSSMKIIFETFFSCCVFLIKLQCRSWLVDLHYILYPFYVLNFSLSLISPELCYTGCCNSWISLPDKKIYCRLQLPRNND